MAAGSGSAACVPGTWCWVHGAPIADIASAGRAVFAVGARGTVLEWTEAGFRRHPAFTQTDLASVWLSSADDVWVASTTREIFRYDGARWSTFAAEGGTVRGSAPDDVWLETNHYDGVEFRERKPEMLGALFDLLVVDRDDVWLLGLLKRDAEAIDLDGTVALHYDGRNWTQRGNRIDRVLWNGRLARVAGELWAYSNAVAYRFDGGYWQEMPGPYGLDAWRLAAESGARTETISLFDGEQIAAVPAETECVRALRAGADEAFCFSAEGELYRSAGSSWRRAPQDVFGTTLSAEDWGRFPPALWSGNASLAWGSGPDNVFRASALDLIPVRGELHRLEHYDGEHWTEIARGDYFDIAGSAADDVWMVGKPLRHWDGSALREVPVPDDVSLSAAVSFGPEAAWFIATRSLPEPSSVVLRYDGSWTVEYVELAASTFNDIAGNAPDDLWLLATRQPMRRERGTGTLIHYDGKTWHVTDLWQTWGFGELVLGDEHFWLSDPDSVYRVPLSDLNAADSFVPSISRNQGRLWLGPSDVWLTTAHQAMRLTL